MKKIFTVILFSVFTLSVFAQSEDNRLQLLNNRMNGRDVEILQKQLIYLGYDLGSDGADGWFGPGTSRALIKFQQDTGRGATTGKWSPTDKVCDMNSRFTITKTTKPTNSDKQNLRKMDLDDDISKFNTPKTFSSFFGSFVIAYTNERRPDYIGELGIPSFPAFNKVKIEKELVISPNGRYMAAVLYDNYANTGSSGFVLIDLLTEKTFLLEYSKLETGLNTGLRDCVYDCEISWTKDNKLIFNPKFDYEGDPAHPGHEPLWKEKLGNLAGKSDPLDAGWYLITIDSPGSGTIKPYKAFLE